MMPRVLISGASGMLGSVLVQDFLKLGWQVVGLYHRRPMGFSHQALTTYKMDLTAPSSSELQLDGPVDLAIHCAALTNLDSCEENFAAALDNNVLASFHFAQIFSRHAGNRSRFVYISSDAIYPDMPQAKSELVTPDPQTRYGLTKLCGEQVVNKELGTAALILRTTIVGFGENQLCSWLLRSVIEKKTIRLFSDVYFSPLSVYLMADLVIKAWDLQLNHTYNLASRDSISKAEFAFALLSRLNMPFDHQKVSLRELESKVKRSFNAALNSDRFYASIAQRGYSVQDSIQSLAQHAPTYAL